ncbi:MAG: ATP-grasp domain-containing protein [Promethearchaeota archaeon]
MTSPNSHIANGKRPSVLVIGFNVRPLARSAKLAGYRVLAVDYWGDVDLPQWADQHIAVLQQDVEQRPDRPQVPTAQVLVKEAQQILSEHPPIEHILVGGGFDDNPDCWNALITLGKLAGNTTEILQHARNRNQIATLAEKCGASIPDTYSFSNMETFRQAINRLDLPVVVKPKRGSGGFHTRLIQTEDEVEQYLRQHRFEPEDSMIVQELIKGTDASVSILGTGKEAYTVSINEQLIGLPQLGKGRTKAYCGNIVPLKSDSKTRRILARISEKMATSLGLIGSNGFDFVVDSEGTPFFMEVNPRFQATIEAIEFTTGINLVQCHLDACSGRLPSKRISYKGCCTRVIVYARFPCSIPDLRELPGVVDIPVPGSHAERGDPICTVNHVASTRKEAFAGAWQTVNIIYQMLSPLKPQC